MNLKPSKRTQKKDTPNILSLAELKVEKEESGVVKPNTWIEQDHFHCKRCGEEMTFLGRLNWNMGTGVRALGVCDWCSLVVVQSEYGFWGLWNRVRVRLISI